MPSHARSVGARVLFVGVAARLALASGVAFAQAAPPAAHQDAAFDVMNLLAHHGLHDIDDESWNAYGQLTFIGSYKPAFHAPYTNFNQAPLTPGEAPTGMSLLPGSEGSFTMSFTLFFGLRLWKGAEAYVVPEAIAERPLSQLRGIGGAIQNFELQKQGSETPQIYRSRTYLRQTIELGGHREAQESNPMQLATTWDSRRLVFTVGNFTILDVFDRNSVSWDPRQTFFNMAFMTYASWDFPSDARGYSWGGTAELFWDDWSVRLGRITPPQQPNNLPIDFRFWELYGDEVEIEHDHTLLGQDGAVRLLGFHNRVDTGSFADAIAAWKADPTNANAAACGPDRYNYGSTNAMAPDLCFVRRPNDKYGIGLAIEQHVTKDVGVFARAMYADGRTEVDAYNPADRSISLGAVAKGGAWDRPFDVAGAGVGASWISDDHARYLEDGGVDGFVGDGKLNPAPEGIAEAFYSFNLLKALWLSADYQLLVNPGFNADRGPVHVLGGRVHAEF